MISEPKRQRLLVSILGGGFLLGVIAFWWLCTKRPNIAFLVSHSPAQWILYPVPADGSGLPAVELSTEFRRSFTLSSVPSTARISIRSLKRSEMLVNGKPIPAQGFKNWKQASELGIQGLLKPGTNELAVAVFNDNGPPALWLSLDVGEIKLSTDETWQASYAGAEWRPAQLATTPPAINKGNPLYGLETTAASLRARLPMVLVFAGISALLLIAGRVWAARQEREGKRWTAVSINRALWAAVVLLAGAWAILWSNNLGYLPLVNGFDASNHMQYVDYILKHKALPLANEGFEMYQPPLYYLLAAGQLAVFGFSAMQANGVFLLRIFGMACGIATFVLTFLSLRLVFPKSARQQFFGLLLAALMPATFYLCHYVTNEILATALVAASVYVCLRAVTAPRIALGQYFICGVCLGAALLAKSSAIIAIPPVFVVLAWNLYRKGAPIKSAVGYLATVGIAALVVCGWHYGRVMVHYGNPLVGNWDAIVGFKWWQQQGYHTTSYYLPLGRSFSDPFFSAFTNFWDGIYTTLWGDGLCGGGVETDWRPPWNYDLMAVGYIFALVPTVMILLGAVLALVRFIRNPSPEGFLMLSLPALVGLLLLYYSLKVPSYAAAKAFYGSSALVPLCVFGAAGGEFLVRRARLLGALLCVGLGLWAVNTYASFWIRQQASQTHLMIARGFSYDGRHDLAAAQVLEILKNDPQNSAAAALLIDELDEQDRPDDAKTVIARSESFSKDNPDWHVAVGDVLARAKKFDEAAAEARRALDLAPDHLLASHRWSEWLYDGGHKQEAIDACREALRIFPSNPQLHYRLGSAYWDIGQRRDGVAQFRVAVTLNDQGAEGHDRLGYALLTLQQCDEAVAEFRRACELKPKFAGFSTHLALGLACQGKTADAIETYRQALKLDPKYAPALDGLARILATCPDATLRDGAQAVTLANQACELTERKKALYLETLAAAFAETGKFAEAESTMQQAVESAQASGEKEVLENGPKLTQLFQAKQPWRRDSNPKAPSSNL